MAKISGVVIDKATNKGVAGASVMVSKKNEKHDPNNQYSVAVDSHTTKSDNFGVFSFDKKLSGEWDILISFHDKNDENKTIFAKGKLQGDGAKYFITRKKMIKPDFTSSNPKMPTPTPIEYGGRHDDKPTPKDTTPPPAPTPKSNTPQKKPTPPPTPSKLTILANMPMKTKLILLVVFSLVVFGLAVGWHNRKVILKKINSKLKKPLV